MSEDQHPPYAAIRAWTTIDLSDPPDLLARDAVKQAALWDATSRGLDDRFTVFFDTARSDADMAVVGREEDLLPLLADVIRRLQHMDYRGRFHADAPTRADAERLYDCYTEGAPNPGNWVLATVEHDPEGCWELPADNAD